MQRLYRREAKALGPRHVGNHAGVAVQTLQCRPVYRSEHNRVRTLHTPPSRGTNQYEGTKIFVLRERPGVRRDETFEVLSWLPRPDVQGKGTTDAALKKSRANLRFTLGLHVVVVDAQSNLAKSLGSESFADQTLKETGRRQYHPHVAAPTQ